MSDGAIAELVHELRIHQVELKMQNDELQRIQEDLETARDRYAYLYDFAPTAYFIVDKKGVVVESIIADDHPAVREGKANKLK